MLALAGIAAIVLAVGGVAVAAAATSDSSPSPSASAAPSPGSTAPPRRERQPFLAGTVVSASGTTITITDVQGFQRTIHTTSATTYADGLTATPAAGTRIYADGHGRHGQDLAQGDQGREAARPRRRPRLPGSRVPGPGPGRHHDRDGDKGGAPATPTPTPSPTA